MDDDDSTQRAPRETVLAEALAEILAKLEVMDPTPQARALRSQARSYELAMKKWKTFPPTYAQVDALFEVVMELHQKVSRQK